MDNHQDGRREAAIGLITAYAVIAKLLTGLTPPITIPVLKGSAFAAEIGEALILAFRILPEHPMNGEANLLLRESIVDWMFAAEMMFSHEEEPEPWKLDVVELQVVRILCAADLVIELLAPEPDSE